MENKHLVIQGFNGVVHVIPASVIRDVITGKMHISEIEDWEQITRRIFQEWYDNQMQKEAVVPRPGSCPT